MTEDDLNYYRLALTTLPHGVLQDTTDPDGAALIKEIEAHFDGLSLRHGLTWIQGEMRDNHESAEMLTAGGMLDRFDRWQDVPAALLANFPCAVSFLDDDGLDFYTPVIMCWEIRYGLRFHSGSPADMLDSKYENNPQFFNRFTPLQRQLIVRYHNYRRGIFNRVRHS